MNRLAISTVIYFGMHIQFIAVAEEHWQEHRYWIAFALFLWIMSSPSEDS